MPRRLTRTECDALRGSLRAACGLDISQDKSEWLSEVVTARMGELELTNFGAYHRRLTGAAHGEDELGALAVQLTVPESYFFRNKGHWRVFEDCVVPWIAERASGTGDRRLRIWSAGCSTGEEAYTAAIVLSRSLPELHRWSVEIVGTDLSPAAITAARRAEYSDNSFRGVPAGIRERYFEPAAPGTYRPRGKLRKMVRFRQLNLVDQASTAGIRNLDVIFCRNVLIYFDAAGARRVVSGFHDNLRRDGYLFLGHAEGTRADAARFATLHVHETFLYKALPRVVGTGESTVARQETASARSRPAVPRSSRPADAAHPPLRVIPSVAPAAPEVTRRPKAAKPIPVGAAPSLKSLRARALDQLRAEEHAAARSTFDEILRREPGDVDGLLGMALLLAGEGDSDAALQCCERVLASRPLSAEAYCVRALVHEGLGDDPAALRAFEKTVYLDADFSVAHLHLAAIHERAHHPDAARRGLRNALRALPADDEQRVRLYSGGFDKATFAPMCERRLGVKNGTD